MQCVNTLCQKDIAVGARFCPFCRTEQPFAQASKPVETATGVIVCSHCYEENPSTATSCSRCGTRLLTASPFPFPMDAAVVGKASSASPSMSAALPASEVIVMRAGDAIWHGEEAEGEVVPGQRRPLVILDEHVVHLAHTSRRLDPQVLQARVQGLLASQQAPVDVALIQTRWLRDPGETRPRLVAWLSRHPYSDIKLLLGVDYMGNWASIQMHLGMEPEIRQHQHIERKSWFPPIDAIIALVLGVIGLMIFIGIFAIGYAIWRMYTSYKAHERDQAQYVADQRERHAQRERHKAMERMSRTFKVDDMRLFCSAMREVFQAVVDDIVEQGGEVTRIEGGKGGFFQEEGLMQPASVQRRSDAAQVGV